MRSMLNADSKYTFIKSVITDPSKKDVLLTKAENGDVNYVRNLLNEIGFRLQLRR